MMSSLHCIAEKRFHLLWSEGWVPHVCDRVAIGAQRNQVGTWIDVVRLSDRSERLQVMDMNEPVRDRPVRFAEIQPACGAFASVLGEAGNPEERISLVFRQMDLKLFPLSPGDSLRSGVQLHLNSGICLVQYINRRWICSKTCNGYQGRPSIVVIEVAELGLLMFRVCAGALLTGEWIDRRRNPRYGSGGDVPANTLCTTFPHDLPLPGTFASHLRRCRGEKQIGRNVYGVNCRSSSRSALDQDGMFIAHRSQCSGLNAASVQRGAA